MGEEETSEDLRLTQAEAEARAALLDVRRYDIAVDLTDLLTGTDVRCVSTISFTSREPGTPTFVDCAATVVSARLNGDDLPPPEQGRIALTSLAAENTLVVETVQPETTDGQGVHRSVDPADKEVYVWTSFEPDEARHVWACFDQPDLKAPHAFTVTAPETWRVVSNSGDPVVEEAQAPDGSPARRWTFPDTPRSRRTTPSCWPVPSTRSGARSTVATSASSRAGRWRRSSTATPTSCSRSPARAWRSSARSSRCRSRRPSTTRSSCPSSAAPWRTTAASPGPTRS